jgi:uncharacterized protein
MDDTQQAIIAFLSDPQTHNGARVEIMHTHISLIFLAGERALKLKRAVIYPYVDFSTVERRRAACLAELALNRRTAPQLYLGVAPIVRSDAGALVIGTDDDLRPALDWIVIMRRFPQDALLSAMATRGALSARLIADLARNVALFHAGAEIDRQAGGAAGAARVIEINDSSLRASGLFAPARIDLLAERSRSALAEVAGLLDARRASGLVRRCHGDLHLGNVCLIGRAPVPFDCLEFDESLARIDVLYDLAFLLMDLWRRDLRNLANLAFNRYLDETGDEEGLAALPLFLSLRAGVRAHVTATAALQHADEAARRRDREMAAGYLDQALAFLEPAPRLLVAIGGLSGTGKSTLAAALAQNLAPPPGARIVSSDRIRKRLFGVKAEEKLPPAAYSAAISERVYQAQRDVARRTLGAKHQAIADAVFAQAPERQAMAAVARAQDARFFGFWLTTPPAVQEQRVAARKDDASDADLAVVRRQQDYELGPIEWRIVDAGRPVPMVVAELRQAIDQAPVNATSAPARSCASADRA